MSAVLLFSGGLDSLIYWHLLDKPPCIYVCLGHRYEGLELETIASLKTTCPDLEVNVIKHRLHLGDIEREDAYIPLRNLLLVEAASLEPSVNNIYLGALAGESSRDKSGRFFRDTKKLLSFLHRRPVGVFAPFRHLTKTQLVALYLQRGYLSELLKKTVSCYRQDGFCGECRSCFRRWVAMSNNGLIESYRHNPQQFLVGNWKSWFSGLLKIALTEWPAVLRNNHDAWRAMR